jgi:hypothetical protein
LHQSPRLDVRLKAGNRTFVLEASYAAGGAPGAIANADFKGDGYADIVVDEFNVGNEPISGSFTVRVFPSQCLQSS